VSVIRLGERAAVCSRRRDVYPRGQLHDSAKGNSHPPSLSGTVMSPPAYISGTAETGLRKCIHLDTECTASSRVSPVCVNRVMWFCGSFLAMRLPETKQSTGVKFCHGGMLLT
jgi:hypothetical protein